MPSKARNAAVLLIAAIAILAASGCGEDRSNLLPVGTSERIENNLDQVRSLSGEGKCFQALAVAEQVRDEVESLGAGVDDVLKRNLLDGVTQLQITVQEECEQVDLDPAEAVVPELLPEDPTVNAPEPEQGATGDSGTTGPTGGGGNDPDSTPEPEPNPDPDPPVDNGSGGVGPGTGGVGP